MKLAIGIIVLLLAVVVYLRSRVSTAHVRVRGGRPGGSVRSVRGRQQAVTKTYRATSIMPGETACHAVQQLQGRRFLGADGATPTLPLEGCDAASCECRYAHHADRRDNDDDRRLAGNLQAQLYEVNSGDERRSRRRGRRRDDRT